MMRAVCPLLGFTLFACGGKLAESREPTDDGGANAPICGREPCASPPVPGAVEAGGSTAVGPDAMSAPSMDASLPQADTGVPIDASSDAFAEATTDAQYVSGGGLPSTAACLTGGNVLWVEGDPDSWWFTGTQTVTGGQWAAQAESYYATYDGTLFDIRLPNSAPTDPWWYFAFNTWGTGRPMEAGIRYSNGSNPPAGVVPIQSGDFVIGYTGTCGALVGTFRVDEFTASPITSGGSIDKLLTFTASFSAVCEQTKVGVLRGCIHYGGP